MTSENKIFTKNTSKKMAMIKENDPFKDARIAEIENEKNIYISMC